MNTKPFSQTVKSVKSDDLKKTKALKYVVKKYCHHYKTIQTYCLSCKKRTDSIGSKKVIMTNKVIRHASKCANCVTEKLKLLKQKYNKKTFSYIFHILFTNHYNTCCRLV